MSGKGEAKSHRDTCSRLCKARYLGTYRFHRQEGMYTDRLRSTRWSDLVDGWDISTRGTNMYEIRNTRDLDMKEGTIWVYCHTHVVYLVV